MIGQLINALEAKTQRLEGGQANYGIKYTNPGGDSGWLRNQNVTALGGKGYTALSSSSGGASGSVGVTAANEVIIGGDIKLVNAARTAFQPLPVSQGGTGAADLRSAMQNLFPAPAKNVASWICCFEDNWESPGHISMSQFKQQFGTLPFDKDKDILKGKNDAPMRMIYDYWQQSADTPDYRVIDFKFNTVRNDKTYVSEVRCETNDTTEHRYCGSTKLVSQADKDTTMTGGIWAEVSYSTTYWAAPQLLGWINYHAQGNKWQFWMHPDMRIGYDGPRIMPRPIAVKRLGDGSDNITSDKVAALAVGEIGTGSSYASRSIAFPTGTFWCLHTYMSSDTPFTLCNVKVGGGTLSLNAGTIIVIRLA